ncbi:hypothetical protein FE257_012174 [Aspergillus nanangensis]|uniref:Uncharacterized protein n=1 Tax=Aspergillus nanangensis TaxID=2582783 RepID=A0AAD4CGB6_ASPNN|nr:hypothetical protein FE257_012174 [Aspergillus nanangensis]
MKAALPFFRAQRSGTIVNISSVGGIRARPAFGGYSTSKFGLEGLSECVAEEVAPFNIRVLLVEPGSFRTNFLGAFQYAAAGTSSYYKGTAVDNALHGYGDKDGKQPGDPEKAAQRIVDVVLGRGMGAGKSQYLRLPLGRDCVLQIREKISSLEENLEAMEKIASSTDFQ